MSPFTAVGFFARGRLRRTFRMHEAPPHEISTGRRNPSLFRSRASSPPFLAHFCACPQTLSRSKLLLTSLLGSLAVHLPLALPLPLHIHPFPSSALTPEPNAPPRPSTNPPPYPPKRPPRAHPQPLATRPGSSRPPSRMPGTHYPGRQSAPYGIHHARYPHQSPPLHPPPLVSPPPPSHHTMQRH